MSSEDVDLQAIEAIETIDEAVEYLVAHGFTREQADAFVRGLLAAPDDPSWPRKDH